jgi:hypothetical protein
MIVSVRIRRVLLDGVEPAELPPSELATAVEQELRARLGWTSSSCDADRPATARVLAGREIAAAVHARLPDQGGHR